MSFWNQILSGKKQLDPQISFGRYTDAYKSSESYLAWDESLRLFEEGKVVDSIKSMLDYLKNNKADNISIVQQEPEFKFLIYHGSKQIHCSVSENKFRAESKVAHCKELNIGFLRKAIEYNYMLNYSRFALDEENNICLLFDTMLTEASPYKLFYGIKELALESDKEDDVLIDEFDSLEPLQNQHIVRLTPKVIAVKIELIRNKCTQALSADVLGKLNPKRYQGALTYVYLSVLYSIDYLLKPEGPLLELISSLHIRYFEMVSENTESKISVLEKGLIEIQEMKDEELAEELYDVISTFGITNPANHKTISQFIESELQALKWYEENKHESICIAICNYIAGYCLYNFAIASPVHELFHLYYEIVEHDYFIKLGFKNEYWDQIQNKPDADEIYERIEEILKEFKPRFQNLPVTTHLNESSASGFLKSYLLFISNLNLS